PHSYPRYLPTRRSSDLMYAYDMSEEDIRAFNPNGIILSGGPESVHLEGSPRAPQVVFELGVPVLGICYGLQTMCEQLGGKVEPGDRKSTRLNSSHVSSS